METPFQSRVFEGVTLRESQVYPGLWVSENGQVVGPKNHWLKLSVGDAYGYLRVGYRYAPKEKCRRVNVHRLVAECWVSNPQKLSCVDHIDGNAGNNAASNLRYVTRRGNMQNRKEHREKTGTSQFVGVHWNTSNKRWKSQIQIDGKIQYLGLFATEELGAQAYDNALVSIGLPRINFPG